MSIRPTTKHNIQYDEVSIQSLYSGTPITNLGIQSSGLLVSGTTNSGMVLLSDTELSGDTANFDFTSIPSTYKSLHLDMSLRSNFTGTSDGILLRFNNDSGSNYDVIRLVIAATVTSAETLAGTSIRISSCMGDLSVSGDYGISYSDIINYASSSPNKDIITVGGLRLSAGTGDIRMQNSYGHWRSSANAIINRITIFPLAGTAWKAGSRISLYGIT